MENLQIYEAVRNVPPEALKAIQAGRLKGKSDINPMWRFKTLTEQFGPVGFGWKYTIDRCWLEHCEEAKEIAAFVEISLYVKHNGEWSEAIPGTGGSSFLAQERNGPYMSDECFKMALTDAISVSCKALGVAADVYWESDKTKYDKPNDPSPTPPPTPPLLTLCPKCGNEANGVKVNGNPITGAEFVEKMGMCYECHKIEKAQGNG